jgi:hypothetical protein
MLIHNLQERDPRSRDKVEVEVRRVDLLRQDIQGPPLLAFLALLALPLQAQLVVLLVVAGPPTTL